MKLKFLGTGTSQGVPVIGCTCEVCTSENPKDSRLRSSVMVTTDENKKILIDGGPDFRQQMLTSGCEKLDAILFTHEHADHTAGLDDIRPFNYLQGGAMPVYLHPRVYQAPSFDVKNQQEQHPLMYKMFNTEQWISFAILSFVLLLISFNLVGALTLLVMDKRRDFVLFRNLGMEKSAISWVVFWEGIWVSAWGTAVGLMMGVGLVLLQQKTSWVSTQGTFSIPYPVELRAEDLLLVLGLNTALGILSAVVPAWRAGKLSGELSSVRQ